MVAPDTSTPLLIACRPFGTRTVMSYVALSRGWSLHANHQAQISGSPTARPSPASLTHGLSRPRVICPGVPW